MPITVTTDNYWTRITCNRCGIRWKERLGIFVRPVTISPVPVGIMYCLWFTTGTR